MRENVEAELDLLLNLDVLKFGRFFSDQHVADAPIKPGESRLDVERRGLAGPRLSVVDLVDPFEQCELFVFALQIQGVLHLRLIGLAHTDETL